MGGWDGHSSSPVGLPGLRAVVLWSFGGLPFVGSGGERRSYVVSGGGHCRLSVVVGRCCQCLQTSVLVRGS